jgi:hypothetical protein
MPKDCSFFFSHLHKSPRYYRSGLLTAVLLATSSDLAMANCYQTGTGAGSTYTCDTNAPNPYTTGKLGAPEGASASASGVSNGNYNSNTVNILAGSTINPGNSSAISLYNNATINVYGLVQNAATNATGSYGTGGNTIEFNNNSTLRVYSGGTVYSQGTQGSAEAVNPQGNSGRNTITVDAGGVIKTDNAAAIWNQSGAGLTINNSGIIQSRNNLPNNTNAVIGGNTAGGVNFYNFQGASTYGSLTFTGSSGPLNLYYYGGSTITGNIGGGGGNSSLYLTGTVDQTLTNTVTGTARLYRIDPSMSRLEQS